MELLPGTISTLVRIELQTLGVSVLFLLAGQSLVRILLPDNRDRSWSLAFRYASGYLLGLSLFLVSLVALSRVTDSARVAFWTTLVLFTAASIVPFFLRSGPRQPLYRHVLLVICLLVAVGVFTVTNATLWLEASSSGPSPEPGQLTIFGSLHSGRYAKYSIYVAEHDRIPFAPQNMGQALLASIHLLLGCRAPLAALMAWIPCLLTAFACLVYGFFRSSGLSRGWALGGAFFVLYCNISLSLVSTLIVDSGSPLGFAGYSDVILAGSTFLLAAVAVQCTLVDPEPQSRWRLLLPGLFGIVWCWYGPQNVVVMCVAVVVTGLYWLRTHPTTRTAVASRLGVAMSVFAVGVIVGSLQLGTFLPQFMREDVGSDLSPMGGKIHVRPYVQYVTTNWTRRQTGLFPQDVEWIHPQLYEIEYRSAKSRGTGTVVAGVLRLFESHLFESCRIYGFLLLGLFLMHRVLRTRFVSWRCVEAELMSVWFWLSLTAFVVGYLIVFGLEIGSRSPLGNFGYIKWWLTRFLVPGCILCLTGLVLAAVPPPGGLTSWTRRGAWGLMVVLGCFGPMLELSGAFTMNWVQRAEHDPLTHRLNLLAHVTGSNWEGSPFAKTGFADTPSPDAKHQHTRVDRSHRD
jgi:hypothetical protein